MPVIDFKEIPSARADRSEKGQQDTFELFAREFLELIGFSIISQPNRGADGGKDILVEEVRRGVGGESRIRWMVSCKHEAHSGKSVSADIESNVVDRVTQHGCHGFMAFYSTLPSSGLGQQLDSFHSSKKLEVQVFDRERIEKYLLGSGGGISLAKRFFPKSIQGWGSSSSRPASIVVSKVELFCQHTGQNLLDPEPRGIIVFWNRFGDDHTRHCEDIYWCLKGEPDDVLASRFEATDLVSGWEDIPDVLIPTVYLKWCLTTMNQLRDGDTYSDQAFEKLKKFLVATFPYVSRDLTDEQRARVNDLMFIPSFVGGLG